MSSKTILLERGPRDYICKSCLSALRRQPARPPARWGVRHASQAAAAQVSGPPRKKPLPTDDPERLRTLRKLGLLKEEGRDTQLKVNYFEEAEGGKLRRLDSHEQFAGSVNDAGGEFSAQLEELEKGYGEASKLFDLFEKADIEERKLHNKVVDDQLNSGLDKALDSTQRLDPAAINALDELSDELERTSTGPMLIDLNHPYAARWNTNEMIRINKLNNNLDLAARQLDRGNVNAKGFELWKWYSAARKTLARNWETVPAATWEVLWEVFSIESSKNPNRWSHVHNLAKDMNEAGFKLVPQRQLMAIEALFLEGWHKEAIENHKKSVATLGTDSKTFLDFWQLGLRMYCHSGDLERAERLLDIIFESSYQYDPRVAFPLIRAFGQKSETVDKAYELYRVARSKLGDAMTIEDYDEIVSSFLAADQAEKALWIFVEMMTNGRIDLRHMSNLPPSVANGFFIGKWLKRLIGTGDFDGAYNALLHVKAKGVMPSPIVVNVLVGAWLRSGSAENIEKAEMIAWAMINSRIMFVQDRAQRGSLAKSIIPSTGLASPITVKHSRDGWPSATLETFSLLAESFKDRGVLTKMEELWRAFRAAEIGPDSFFMNQMLFSLLRNGQGKNVRGLYRALTDEFKLDKLQPDSWTFLALWQALAVNRLQTLRPEQVPTERVASRELFAEMVGYAASFQKEGMDSQLARNIMHTFRQLEDPFGMLVAFRALRQVFQVSNAGSMVLELLAGTTNVEKAAGSVKLRKNLVAATQRIEHYLSQRQKEMVKAGQLRKKQDIPEEVRTVEMANLLELHLESQLAKVPNAQELFMQAAQEMGVYSSESDDVD
ncbi:hypothetical protein JX265_004719 [Neoarthrinium moseri]|uniref:Pentatricopeptide repeat protein n=1 Tax=Neoarthrinium moseri TaxID=1658444 RepID=A0A9Q0ARZ2_9PEZI|nr:hypothetical protein JX266_012205 [Neoarthrinium moseri]KAI1874511.1 hypothetical protein JX265_004719 [Neoarthrinium moseri]